MRMLAATPESVAFGTMARFRRQALAQLASQTEAFSLMKFAASSLHGGGRVDAVSDPNQQTFDTLARYLPQSVKRAPFWATQTKDCTFGLRLPQATNRSRSR